MPANFATSRTTAPPTFSEQVLNRTTLLRQSLLERSSEAVPEAIHRLAGLQAQYPNSPYVALWSRLRDFAIEDLELAIEERTVVKATTIRGTLHLVAAEDFPAFNAASPVARIANWRPSAIRAGVDTADLHRRLLAFAHEPRTIAEMEADLETLASDASLAPHVPGGVRHVAFLMASVHGWLVHVPPSGRWDLFAKPRYIDAGVWLPNAIRLDAAEGLRLAIQRYLGAYGPASIADIGKWIGQPRLALVRDAVEALGDRLRRFRGPGERDLVDLRDAPLANGDEPAPGRFLARWDSALIGYQDRGRILPDAFVGDVIKHRNADFLPSFTVDGLVAGTWSVATSADEAVLEIRPLVRVAGSARSELMEEAEGLVRFIGRNAGRHDVRWINPSG